jgi:hypothetical protein
VNTQKEYYKELNLGTMRVVISFKLEKSEIDFDPKMGFGALNVVYSVLAGALTISDASLKFSSLS